MLPELALRLMSEFSNTCPASPPKLPVASIKPTSTPEISEKANDRYKNNDTENISIISKPKQIVKQSPHKSLIKNREDMPSQMQSRKQSVSSFDSQPIKSIAKPFELMLEESLKKQATPKSNGYKPKKEYLKRKASGVAPCQLIKKNNYIGGINKSEAKIEHACEASNEGNIDKLKLLYDKKGSRMGGELQKQDNLSDNKVNIHAIERERTYTVNYDEVPINLAEKKILNEKNLCNSQSALCLEYKSHTSNDKELLMLKKEIEKIKKQKDTTDKENQKLISKIEEMSKHKEQQYKEIMAYKESETKKIQQEKRVMERQTKAMQAMPNRKDRAEIVTLKKELEKEYEEAKAKKLKYKMQMERIRRQNEELVEKNKQFSREIEELQKRLEDAKKMQENVQIEKESDSLEEYKKNEQLVNQNIDKNIIPEESSVKEESEHASQNNVSETTEKNEFLNNNSEKHTKISSLSTSILNAKRNSTNNTLSPQKEYASMVTMKTNDIQAPEDYQRLDTDEFDPELKEDISKISPGEYGLSFPPQYHQIEMDAVIEQKSFENKKIQKIYASGKKEIIFSNGVKKESFPDSYSVVYFNNGDIKQTFPDGKIVYYFTEANTTQTTLINGVQIFKFTNKQIEKHYPDGKKEIKFADGTVKRINKYGKEESE